jgi:hypothetical protein
MTFRFEFPFRQLFWKLHARWTTFSYFRFTVRNYLWCESQTFLSVLQQKDRPLTFQSWLLDYLLDWTLYQLRSLMSHEIPHIWHLLSITRLNVQLMSIVTVYNIFIGCLCFLHTLPVALFLSFDSLNANWVLLDHGKLCFYHAISMRLTTIYILLYSSSTKNCVDVIVLVVHCCWRRIKPILFSCKRFSTTFWSYFDMQQFGLCWVDASIVCILLLN